MAQATLDAEDWLAVSNWQLMPSKVSVTRLEPLVEQIWKVMSGGDEQLTVRQGEAVELHPTAAQTTAASANADLERAAARDPNESGDMRRLCR